jgi:hypothetical protein
MLTGGSVLVPVAVVSRVAMSVVDVVDVVAVGDRLVPAAVAMGVLVILVNDVLVIAALVPVPVVQAMGVSVVQIIGVVAVGYGHVPTAGAVDVIVVRMGVVGRGHAWCSS